MTYLQNKKRRFNRNYRRFIQRHGWKIDLFLKILGWFVFGISLIFGIWLFWSWFEIGVLKSSGGEWNLFVIGLRLIRAR